MVNPNEHAIYAEDYGVSASATRQVNRIALYNALVAGSAAKVPVYLPPGVISVGQQHNTEYGIRLNLSDVDLRADPDEGSTLMQSGPGGADGWQMIQISGGDRYTFGRGGGLTFAATDLTSPTPTSDQYHIILILGITAPVNDVRFEETHFLDAGSGAQNTGDAVKTVGTLTNQIRGLVFQTCTFYNCGRSSVSPNYHTYGISFFDCESDLPSDQHLDLELSGGPVEDIIIQRCRFGETRSGNVMISLGGFDTTQMASNVRIEDSTFAGGLQGGYCHNVSVKRCTFSPKRIADAVATISFLTRNTQMLFEDCVINHWLEQGTVPAVSFYNQYLMGSIGVVFRRCTVNQYAPTHVMQFLAADEVELDECTVNYLNSTQSSAIYGVWVRTLEASVTDFQMLDCAVNGNSLATLGAGVGFSPSGAGYTMAGILVAGLEATRCAFGLVANATQSFYVGEPRYYGAVLGTGVALIGQDSTGCPLVCLAGEPGDTNIRTLTAWLDPEGLVTAILGCSYIKRVDNTVWYKTTGTVAAPTNTGWVKP